MHLRIDCICIDAYSVSKPLDKAAGNEAL